MIDRLKSLANGQAKQFLLWGLLLCMVVLISACGTKPVPPPKHVSSEELRPLNVRSATPLRDPGGPAAPAAGPTFQFRDATKDWKLDFTRYDAIHGQNAIQEGPGGGLAVLDYDLDGQLDLFFCQGSRLPRTKITTEFTNELYRNVGHQLQRTTAPSGLTSHGFYTGAAVGDIDEDGYPDLYVTAYGKTSVWHNNGDGTFHELTEAVVDSWSSSAALADFNDDGLLDLFVVTYVEAQDDPPRICKEPKSPTGTLQCSPTLYPALDDLLLINDGQGGFVDVTQNAGITGKDGKGLAVGACDVNGDGILDIVVANDGTPTFLYVRTGKSEPSAETGIVIPKFEERGAELGVAISGEGRTIAGMAVGHGDYDRDGWLDLFITNFYLEPNILFRNVAGNGFIDCSAGSRLGPLSRLTLSFGAEFLDVDNDAWLDLVATTGHIDDRSWADQEPFRMQPHLFRNDHNGRFTDVASGAGSYFTSKTLGRGLALGDLDRNGAMDIVIVHREDPSVLLLNETPRRGTSVVIRPVGTNGSARSGIGTRVIATGITPPLLRDVAGGGSFQSASALELHFGLGDLTQFDQLECTWPNGQVERWSNVKAGYYVAIQGQGLVAVETLGAE